MLAFGYYSFLLLLFIFIPLKYYHRRQRNVHRAILPQPSEMPVESTKDLKENKLHLAKTLTQMKQSTMQAKAKNPLGEMDSKSCQYDPNGHIEWTWQKDNKLLLAVARFGCDQEYPDFERISTEYFGRDEYPPAELENRFFYLAFQNSINQLTRVAMTHYGWEGSAPKG